MRSYELLSKYFKTNCKNHKNCKNRCNEKAIYNKDNKSIFICDVMEIVSTDYCIPGVYSIIDFY